MDSYTKALLHMNGADASTTFIDDSGKTWTAAADAQIDTAQSVFGGASGLFDGTGDYISTPTHVDFAVGAGDWTVDFWMRPAADGGTYWLMGEYDGSTPASRGLEITKSETNKIGMNVWWGAGGDDNTGLSSTIDVLAGSFSHVAFVRYGNTLTVYVGGTACGTADLTGKTVNDSSDTMAIGALGAVYSTSRYAGWIDEFRYSKGIARWTANFTPPTSAYGGGGLMLFSS